MMEAPFPAFNHTLAPYTIEEALDHQQTQPRPYNSSYVLPNTMYHGDTQVGRAELPYSSETLPWLASQRQVDWPMSNSGNSLARDGPSPHSTMYPAGHGVSMNNTGTSPPQNILAALHHGPGVSGGRQNHNQEAVYVNNQVVVPQFEPDVRPVTSRLMAPNELPRLLTSRLTDYPFEGEPANFIPRLIDSYNGGPVHCSSAGRYMCSVILHSSVVRIDIYVNAWDDPSRDLKGMVYWKSWSPEQEQVQDTREYRRVNLDLRMRTLGGNLEGLQHGWPKKFSPSTRSRNNRGPCPHFDLDGAATSNSYCNCPPIRLRNTYEFILEARTLPVGTTPCSKDKIHVWFQPGAK